MASNIYLLRYSLNQFFKEIDNNNTVVISNSCLSAMIFDNIYTANSFKTLLNKQYQKEFHVINI